MLLPRLTVLPLALILPLGMLGACVRQAPPAPVVEGERSGSTIAPTPPSLALTSGMRAPVPHPDRIIVHPHDTVYAIARRYDVPVRSLIEANRLAPPYRLTAGHELVVPQIRQHIVQPGETLYSVSHLYGVDASTLARTNGLSPPYMVRVGEALVLPSPVQVAAGSTAEPTALAPIPVTSAPLPPPQIEPVLVAREEGALRLPSPPSSSGPQGFIWPVRGSLIASYGAGENGTHNDGINIAAPRGTIVVAAGAGTVAYAGNELRGYGNLVLIKHINGWMTAYAHNSALLVKRGEKVRRGQPIARVGTTGAVGEPQLHFEIRHGTKALDPVDYLPAITAASARG